MSKRLVPAALCVVFLPFVMGLLGAQTRYRKEVKIPDILGYKTLKCDFHTHTVFSDGAVWPHIRSEEAWREGLDAIAITDHVEYQPHKEDLTTNHDRSFEIAKPHGDQLHIAVIRGSELTRDMPPGHLNAIFLENVAAVDKETWREAVQAASSQGAFIFWNHPAWEGHQPDRVARWYPEHTELVETGMLHGIEVVNGRDYYPKAHRWCLDKKLTMLSNSDIHNPLNLDYHIQQGDHRPLTLVFATDSGVGAIKEALLERRTAVYSGDLLIGEERFLGPIFEKSISIRTPSVIVQGTGGAYVQITNTSEITYRLVKVGSPLDLKIPERVNLQANATTILSIKGLRSDVEETRQLEIPFVVENLKTEPEKAMLVHLAFEVSFQQRED